MKSLAALLLLICASVSQAQSYAPLVDKEVAAQMAKRHVPGVAIAVVRHGTIEYVKGYGLADVEHKIRVTPQTQFKVGSVTKQFTSTVLLQLVQAGKVKIDDPIRQYLADAPETWKEVTIRHLLTHTSGIPSYTDLDDFPSVMAKPADRKQFMTMIGSRPLDFAPGSNFHYNNSGYFLLGLIIEGVTKKPLGKVMEEQIFKPLGMSRTKLVTSKPYPSGLAVGYDPLPNGPKVTAHIDMSWPYAAGSIVSTVEDLAKWDAALYSDKILVREYWDMAWRSQRIPSGDTNYGFGWTLGSINRVPIIGHGGDINGFNADYFRVPSLELSIISLCNSNPGITTNLNVAIAGIVDARLRPDPVKVDPDTDPDRTKVDRDLLERLISGKLKKEEFTPQLGALVFSPKLANVPAQLKTLGKLEDFHLEKDGGARRTYVVQFEQETIHIFVGRDKNGIVESFNISGS